MSDKIRKKTAKIVELVDKGLPIEDAYSLVKPDTKLTPAIRRSMETKIAKHSLMHPKRAKQAVLALDKVLQGELIGKAKSVNTSDIIRASEIILDRVEPKTTINKNLNVNAELDSIDLSRYLNI